MQGSDTKDRAVEKKDVIAMGHKKGLPGCLQSPLS